MTDHTKPDIGPLHNQPRIELSLGFGWTELGEISFDDDCRLVFPTASRGPGLYRFELAKVGANSFYAGQTDNLARRFQHYRTPGRTQ